MTQLTKRLDVSIRLFFCATIMLLGGAGNNASAADSDAAKPVEDFHKTLLHIMKDADRLGYEGRYEALQPAIENRFDTPLIAKVILGHHWEKLNDDQKQQFIETFNELSIATYASRFDSYDGESFEYLGTQSLNKERILVQTRLKKTDGEDVKFDYLMHQRDGEWYIISVVAQGVNDLSLKRTEYTSIMEKKGFDGLLSELRSKIAALKP